MFGSLAQSFSSLFSKLTGQKNITHKNIQEVLSKVKDTLLEADVPLHVADSLLKTISDDVVGKEKNAALQTGEQFIKAVYDALVTFLTVKHTIFTTDQVRKPCIIMMCGLQGAGKTSSIAKLAVWLQHKYGQKKALKIMAGSVDFYRPAARQQLEILAKNHDFSYCDTVAGAPVEAAKEILDTFNKSGADVLFLDTAGRLHVDNALLLELQQIKDSIAPTYTFLVLDAMTGQESLRVAQAFDQTVAFDGAILTKLDSDTRSGAAISFCYEVKKPILFVASGEKADALDRFIPERMASRIIGMGDVQTLLEKAQEKIKLQEQKESHDAFSKGTLTLNDFAKQLEMMNKLGSLSSIVKYMPGMGSLTPDMVSQGETQLKKFKAIISSMTAKERMNHKILNGSRRQRIAKGAGLQVSDVNMLIERFEQTQQFVKLFKRTGKFPGF